MKILLASLLFAASCTLALAQATVVKTIEFTGATQSQTELLTLSGLTPGKAYSKDDVEAAMHRLDDSGLFTSVQYSTKPGSITFMLEPSASSQMQKVRYVNFVWYTQAELNDAVHAKLPLFTGSVPANGELKDQVNNTLAAILKERGVVAIVESEGATGGFLDYKITSPPVVVTDIQIENLPWNSDPVLETVRKAQINIDYLEGISQRGVHENMSYALKEVGFLDENVGPISHSAPTVEANRISVVMTGTATPGYRYKIARVTLPKPAGTVPASELESDNQVKVGGWPSPSLVGNTVARMDFVFSGHGFLDARTTVDASKDSAAHTMSYTISVLPGEVYHFRDVLYAADLTAEQKAQLAKEWKLQPGAVYERATVDRTLMTLKTLCNGHPASQKPIPAPAMHQADVSLSCRIQR